MRSKVTTVVFPVLGGYRTRIVITSDIRKSLLERPETKSVEMTDETCGLAVHTDGFLSFIFLPYDASVGDIAHEAWHVVRHMMEFVGVELDNETCAYHLGFLTNKIFRFMRGRK